MYSRYTPNEGGGYDRTPVLPQPGPPPMPPVPPKPELPERPARPARPPAPPLKPVPPQKPQKPGSGLPGLLRQRLARGFDAGDLLILAILLLILQDSQEDRLATYLTIAFFLLL